MENTSPSLPLSLPFCHCEFKYIGKSEKSHRLSLLGYVLLWPILLINKQRYLFLVFKNINIVTGFYVHDLNYPSYTPKITFKNKFSKIPNWKPHSMQDSNQYRIESINKIHANLLKKSLSVMCSYYTQFIIISEHLTY